MASFFATRCGGSQREAGSRSRGGLAGTGHAGKALGGRQARCTRPRLLLLQPPPPAVPNRPLPPSALPSAFSHSPANLPPWLPCAEQEGAGAGAGARP